MSRPTVTMKQLEQRLSIEIEQIGALRRGFQDISKRIDARMHTDMENTSFATPTTLPINGDNSTPWLKYAESQLGVKEIPDDIHNQNILDYHSTTTGKFKTDEVAWCSSFVNWCVTQSGIEGTNSASALSWKKWGQTLDKPAYGSIAIIDYGNGFGHVGFTVSNNKDGRIVVLGGNQGKPGSVNYSPTSRSVIKKYVYPKGYTPNYNLPSTNMKGRSLDFKSTR